MEQVFSYIIGLGAAVMMPIIFTVLGLCIGIGFSKALKSGLLVGVGFVGLSVVPEVDVDGTCCLGKEHENVHAKTYRDDECSD